MIRRKPLLLLCFLLLPPKELSALTTGNNIIIDVVKQSNTLPSTNDASSRRDFVKDMFVVTTLSSSCFLHPETARATRAVGIAEEECRAAGNCLENMELDGALGWSWGAKDRCDASDPRCGSDGILMEGPRPGETVPDSLGYSITHIVEMSIAIGRSNEDCSVLIGLYGNDVPDSTKEFLQLVSVSGIKTTSDLVFENGVGVDSIPVSLLRGGILNQIVPGERIDFGIPSQSAAYARSKGMSKAGDNFLPQPRPRQFQDVPILRKHDVAGLLSIPGKGIGYGGSDFLSEDECFESSFQLTAQAVPSMDKENRRIIGQVLDTKSMASLARLASLPVKKGFRGVIPGQNSGPPLLKVVVADLSIRKVQSSESDETT